MSAPDAGELKKALNWLEMTLNTMSGTSPLAGFWEIIDIPIEAGIGDYSLSDYSGERGVIDVFSVSLVNASGGSEPLEFEYGNDAVLENLQQTGSPSRAILTKDRDPVLKIYPTPTQTEEDAGYVLRLRVQTYHDDIDPNGTGDEDLLLRPAWYLWVTKKLAYEIGCGPVRRLSESELTRLERDSTRLEDQLLARDGKERGPQPPLTQPMPLSVDYNPSDYKGYRPRGGNTKW
jgi:hypothetical protein